jgi:hypothetical protein
VVRLTSISSRPPPLFPAMSAAATGTYSPAAEAGGKRREKKEELRRHLAEDADWPRADGRSFHKCREACNSSLSYLSQLSVEYHPLLLFKDFFVVCHASSLALPALICSTLCVSSGDMSDATRVSCL